MMVVTVHMKSYMMVAVVDMKSHDGSNGTHADIICYNVRIAIYMT